MTTSKRIIAYHVARLKDKSAAIRLQSIKELELLADAADTEVLEALKDVYVHDPELDVRKAAQEAGRAIYLKQATQK
ncbi:MAG: hypothetical protein MUF87_01950 [Anaerolineae bacterium]|nr:hypothetical protein [Anaerolineae bacterium]